jgi:gluconokinase
MTDDRRPATDPKLLVLDIGSSSVRVWLYDTEGRGTDAGPGTQCEYDWTVRPAGAMETDAEALVARTASMIDAALLAARSAGTPIVGVALATFWHSLLGLDAAGEPVTPVYGWGDSRARPDALRLLEAADQGEYHARTGCYFHPSYPMVKLAWLRRVAPGVFGRAASWVSFPEYLELRLAGRRRCSYSMASGSGLLDVHRLEWDAGALELAGIPASCLSPLVDTEPARGLRPELAVRWPELASVPWFPALGDGACANVGSGAVGVERPGVTIGTSAALRLLWEPAGALRVPEELWCYRLDAARCVVGGALSNGGNAVAFLRRMLRLPPEQQWEARVGAMPPDSHGLTVLPFLMSERGPGWLSETRSALLGATLDTTPEQVLRAWMEAVAYRVGAIYARLSDVAGGAAEVIASGGALNASELWGQMLADVLDRPVALTVEPEATARGAALVALERLGTIPDVAAPPVEVAVRYQPDEERHARYAAAALRQETLLDRLAPWTRAAPPSGREE